MKMTTKTYSMPGEDHIQQFHNAHQYMGDDHARPMWWELPDSGQPQSFAKGGSVITRLRGNKAMPLHPALSIPGVHIRTAEAGEPIFHGEK
jgi:hypothetical protein